MGRTRMTRWKLQVTLLTSEVRIVHLHRVLGRYLADDLDVTERSPAEPAESPTS